MNKCVQKIPCYYEMFVCSEQPTPTENILRIVLQIRQIEFRIIIILAVIKKCDQSVAGS
jgi:hypothetical protein